jgi:hypothetical protein
MPAHFSRGLGKIDKDKSPSVPEGTDDVFNEARAADAVFSCQDHALAPFQGFLNLLCFPLATYEVHSFLFESAF